MNHVIGYSCFALAVLFAIGARYFWPVRGEETVKQWWESMDDLLDSLFLLLEPGGWKSGVLTILAIACLIAGYLLAFTGLGE